MKRFKLWELFELLRRFDHVQHEFELWRKAKGRQGIGVKSVKEVATQDLEKAKNLSEEAGYWQAVMVIGLAQTHLGRKANEAGKQGVLLEVVESELRHVVEALMADLAQRSFIQIELDRAEFVDQDALFGSTVQQNFPTAGKDIKEAGNCLAVECSTAAVFHLMRAVEFALRALATDRQVSYANGALDTKQWGDLVTALESKVADLRKADTSLLPSSAIKNAQVHFYHEAMLEFRSFNEAWRRHISHARENAFYDRYQAFSIADHTRSFMQHLATKISETSTTPLYWTSI